MCLNMEEYVDCEWEEYVDCEDCEWEDYVVIHRRSDDFKVPTDDDEIDVAAAGEEMDEECYEVPVNRVLEACESRFSKGFRVLNQEGILARVQDDIAKLSSVLSLSEEATTRLLCKYGWNIENLCDQWFPDEDKEKVWKFFGLLGINPIGDQSESAAGFSGDYLVATYMGLGRKGSMRWCPAGCGRAVEILLGETGGRTYDVTCDCTREFCWNCLGEAHSPVDCETLDRWKKCPESQNMNWVLANCKACPSCNRLLEDATAGMQAICPSPCNYEFCWLCLGPWSDHDTTADGNYTCRFYGDVKKSDELDETEKERERARISLEKYRYCHERWSTHDEWRQIALLDMQELKAVHLKNLSQVQNRSEDNLEFIIDAWDQIVECRRILKWAYVYGYYIPDDDQWKMNFFEYVLDQAEATLKKLHQCAQTELQIYLKVPLEDFDGFRVKLSKLTSVTRKYFDKLVGAIENGLLMQIQKVAR